MQGCNTRDNKKTNEIQRVSRSTGHHSPNAATFNCSGLSGVGQSCFEFCGYFVLFWRLYVCVCLKYCCSSNICRSHCKTLLHERVCYF